MKTAYCCNFSPKKLPQTSKHHTLLYVLSNKIQIFSTRFTNESVSFAQVNLYFFIDIAHQIVWFQPDRANVFSLLSGFYLQKNLQACRIICAHANYFAPVPEFG